MIISSNQSAFIQGKSIIDNVLMAQELVRGYGRRSLFPRFALKVDLMKAFDFLDWEFILDILLALYFLFQFVGWIAGCIITPKYSISIHRGLVRFFKGERKVRQGDSSHECLI